MTCPICTNDMVYVDNGPRLQYHYCRICKDELKNLMKLVVIEHTPDDIYKVPNLTQEEIDEIFSSVS